MSEPVDTIIFHAIRIADPWADIGPSANDPIAAVYVQAMFLTGNHSYFSLILHSGWRTFRVEQLARLA